jgi:hypothetical protein
MEAEKSYDYVAPDQGDQIGRIFEIFSPQNLAKILAFFAQTTATFCKYLIITLVFEKKRQFFRRKLAKIA